MRTLFYCLSVSFTAFWIAFFSPDVSVQTALAVDTGPVEFVELTPIRPLPDVERSDYCSGCDCGIELSWVGEEVPDLLDHVDGGSCGSGNIDYKINMYLQIVNGEVQTCDAFGRNRCNFELSHSMGQSDGISALMKVTPLPPIPGLATVSHTPYAELKANSVRHAEAELTLKSIVDSSATDCDRTTSKTVDSTFTTGPGGGLEISIDGFGGGGSLQLIIGGGLRTAILQGDPITLTRCAAATEELTTVTATVENLRVFMRGGVNGPARAFTFVAQRDLSVDSKLECGGDIDGDGEWDVWVKVFF